MQESFPDRKPFFASTPAATPTRLIVADRLGWNEISEMFDHIGIVVGDLKRSARLYGGALEPLGLKILEEHSRGPNDGWVVISRGEPGSPFFVVAAGRPSFWGPEARPSLSPVHLCFTAPSKEAVDRFHTLGWTSAPGTMVRRAFAARLSTAPSSSTSTATISKRASI